MQILINHFIDIGFIEIFEFLDCLLFGSFTFIYI